LLEYGHYRRKLVDFFNPHDAEKNKTFLKESTGSLRVMLRVMGKWHNHNHNWFLVLADSNQTMAASPFAMSNPNFRRDFQRIFHGFSRVKGHDILMEL
jgi:hypothetical protein